MRSLSVLEALFLKNPPLSLLNFIRSYLRARQGSSVFAMPSSVAFSRPEEFPQLQPGALSPSRRTCPFKPAHAWRARHPRQPHPGPGRAGEHPGPLWAGGCGAACAGPVPVRRVRCAGPPRACALGEGRRPPCQPRRWHFSNAGLAGRAAKAKL